MSDYHPFKLLLTLFAAIAYPLQTILAITDIEMSPLLRECYLWMVHKWILMMWLLVGDVPLHANGAT